MAYKASTRQSQKTLKKTVTSSKVKKASVKGFRSRETGNSGHHPPVRYLNPSIDRFSLWLKGRGLSKSTVDLRVKVLRRITDDLGDVRMLTASDIGAWLAQYSGWTRITYQSSLVSVYDWLQLSGEITLHPLRALDPRERIQRPPSPEGAPNPFTPAEERELLALATGDVRAILLLGLRQGLRAHEIAKFQGEDIDGRRVRVDGKGGKVARLPLHPDVAALAEAYPNKGYWFPSVRAESGHITSGWVTVQISALLRLRGMKGSIHRARHTYGTTLLRNGATIETVRRLMRHSSLATTQRYVLALEDELEAAIAGLGGTAA